MPLYKLFCIAAHYPEYKHIKDLVQSSAKFLLDQGSVVREVRYLGLRDLPGRMRRHKHKHTIGDYWFMNFDANPRVLAQLNERMRTDNRVIRWTMLKLGEKLTDVADTQQATIIYNKNSLSSSSDGTWSSGGGAGLPDFSYTSVSDILPGTGSGSSTGTEGMVAGLGSGSSEVEMNASLGATSYTRERV